MIRQIKSPGFHQKREPVAHTFCSISGRYLQRIEYSTSKCQGTLNHIRHLLLFSHWPTNDASLGLMLHSPRGREPCMTAGQPIWMGINND
ncbi:hypothetical protein VTN96DRAFT_3167 [Rasamsonia emersonii]